MKITLPRRGGDANPSHNDDARSGVRGTNLPHVCVRMQIAERKSMLRFLACKFVYKFLAGQRFLLTGLMFFQFVVILDTSTASTPRFFACSSTSLVAGGGQFHARCRTCGSRC